MTVFCKRIRKHLGDTECLERIQHTRDIKPLRKCRHCVTAHANDSDTDMVNTKLRAINTQGLIHRQKAKDNGTLRRVDLDMMHVPPQRVCHTCGVPTHGWECKACQTKRREKGV